MKKINIIKIGGNVLDNAQNLDDFLDRFSAIGGAKILVHGGGKIATRVAESLGIPTKMMDGRRVTDDQMELASYLLSWLLSLPIEARPRKFNARKNTSFPMA